MDPNETLRRIRALVVTAIEASDQGVPPDANDSIELAEYVENLDEWLAKGGAPPREWGVRK